MKWRWRSSEKLVAFAQFCLSADVAPAQRCVDRDGLEGGNEGRDWDVTRTVPSGELQGIVMQDVLSAVLELEPDDWLGSWRRLANFQHHRRSIVYLNQKSDEVYADVLYGITNSPVDVTICNEARHIEEAHERNVRDGAVVNLQGICRICDVLYCG